MLRPHLLRLAAWSLLCLPSCVAWESQQDVRISSDPLGARIYVDGVDTGHTTPHRLAIKERCVVPPADDPDPTLGVDSQRRPYAVAKS